MQKKFILLLIVYFFNPFRVYALDNVYMFVQNNGYYICDDEGFEYPIYEIKYQNVLLLEIMSFEDKKLLVLSLFEYKM